ncbi:thioredoxin-disulfide reductase [Candidatus Desulforudis audaxviator]|nr:thioredoxin-disulfide reductase [Candidatus Desulforudis audaxviator]
MNLMKDLVIIGGGPGGLTCGIYAVRSGLDVVLYERSALGGSVLSAEKVENYPGFPGGISGPDLIARMEEHALQIGLPIEFTEVHEITPDNSHYRLRTRDGEVSTRVVVIATGTGPRPLGVQGEDRLRGRGVSYCAVCDGAFFRDQPVAVVGGGDAAVEEAHYLSRFASRVYLVHPRESIKRSRVGQRRIEENRKIETVPNTRVLAISGDRAVDGIVLENIQTGEKWNLKVDGVFVYVGIQPNSYLVEKLVDLDNRRFIITDSHMRTSRPGIYAVGDVRRTPLRQIATAVGDGAIAAIWAEKYITSLS